MVSPYCSPEAGIEIEVGAHQLVQGGLQALALALSLADSSIQLVPLTLQLLALLGSLDDIIGLQRMPSSSEPCIQKNMTTSNSTLQLLRNSLVSLRVCLNR